MYLRAFSRKAGGTVFHILHAGKKAAHFLASLYWVFFPFLSSRNSFLLIPNCVRLFDFLLREDSKEPKFFYFERKKSPCVLRSS